MRGNVEVQVVPASRAAEIFKLAAKFGMKLVKSALYIWRSIYISVFIYFLHPFGHLLA